ncbi:ribulose phosphate epimerase [Nannocystis pusilla]|uniref:ribulose phosphate epimerase n=1 Tax=Nannocystis pusilla TaxID=889268 RepID=UPI003BF2C90F
MKKFSLVSSLLCTALMFGCGDDGKPGASGSATNPTTNSTNGNSSDGTDGETSTGNASETDGTPGTTTTASSPGTTPTTDGPTSDTTAGTDTTDGTFIMPPDGGGGTKECDPWTQDCPPGEKCMPYSGDGDNSWESLKCTPVMENPGQTGDPCTVEGSGVSGIDSCDVGHMCWNTDPDTGEGTCVRFCSGSPDAPTCDVPGTACTIVNDGVLILCLPSCDPLLQNCPGGDLCIPNPQNSDSFICVLDASGEEGQEFDVCEYANACDPGLYCFNSELATECDPNAAGCCLPFCDLMAAECTGQNAECLALYEEGMAPPGLENVGFCGLPQ